MKSRWKCMTSRDVKKLKRVSPAYALIFGYYGDAVAKRSQVPLINHIDEGIDLMESNGASEDAIDAFCLHPLVQGDDQFEANISLVSVLFPAEIVVNLLEYRRAANAYLCKPYTDNWGMDEIREAVGGMTEDVRQMLIADKLQNQKDFALWHAGSHPRSAELQRYFENWLVYLIRCRIMK